MAPLSPASRRLRVAYLDHSASLAGGELALARLLPALDVEPLVILAQHGPLVANLRDLGIRVEVLPLAPTAQGLPRQDVRVQGTAVRASLQTSAYVARLARRLRSMRPDLVHTNSLKSAVYGGLASRLAGVPVVWHVHDRITPEYLPPAAVRAFRAMARLVPHAVIANSHSTLATLPQLGPRARVIASPVPFDDAGPPPGRDRPGHGLRVGMVGRFAPWKGQDVFVNAFASAFPEGDAAGVLIGAPLFGETDYLQHVRELARSHGVDGRVEFVGFVEDVRARLGDLDILVHASLIPEPFGMAVVEGMEAGLPVVAAAAGGPAEIIEDGVSGLLYAPGHVGELATALSTLAQDAELRRRLGHEARTRAQRFAPEVVGGQVMELYRTVTSDGARGAGGLIHPVRLPWTTPRSS